MLVGLVLIGMALGLFLYNQWDGDRAGRASAEVQEKLERALDGEQIEEPFIPGIEQEMKTVLVDGYEYIGYLSIESINLELPVMSQWSYEGLKISPGRYWGSTFTDDLIIAGHNYAKHFSPIKWLDTGTEIDFTDADQRLWRYEVSEVETLKPTQVEDMIAKTETDDWDLTLFTCNTGGETRCAVRCVRIN